MSNQGNRAWPFLAGVVAGAAGAVALASLGSRRNLNPRLFRSGPADAAVPRVVVVPGIMGSQLLRPDGTHAWLNLGNAFGYHDLSLPFAFPPPEVADDLVPCGLLGTEAVLPRLFGFSEYADLMDLLRAAGFRRDAREGRSCHIFAYDWRRDLVAAARRLHATLESLAEAAGDPAARFNLIAHSMGGLVARYYLRYGAGDPGGPVTWAGAARIDNLVLVAVPNRGTMNALEAIINGNRVGFSTTTLAASVVARMPSVYHLLPPSGEPALVEASGKAVDADLYDLATWDRYGWGPYRPAGRRAGETAAPKDEAASHEAFLGAVLAHARAFHQALVRPVDSPCPVKVLLLGGDCLPTVGRAIVPEKRGLAPRLEPRTAAEADVLLEAGDGLNNRVTVRRDEFVQHVSCASNVD